MSKNNGTLGSAGTGGQAASDTDANGTKGLRDEGTKAAFVASAAPLPLTSVLVQKVRGVDAGIHPLVGLTAIGAVHTLKIADALRLCGGIGPEFQPYRAEDARAMAEALKAGTGGQAASGTPAHADA